VDHEGYARAFARMLAACSAEIVHIRQMLGHPLSLARQSALSGRAVVLSLHDHMLVCPNVHLLDSHGAHCAGDCTSVRGPCAYPDRWVGARPPLHDSYVHTWREQVAQHLLPHVHAVVTTSETARDLFRAAYPAAPEVQIIPHGRDIPRRDTAVEPVPGQRVRILLLGTMSAHKGLDFLHEVKRRDRSDRLEFHLLGTSEAALPAGTQRWGDYTRSGVLDALETVGAHLALIPSAWPETWCHTLTEAWAGGLPVAVRNMGALGERMRASGAGLILSEDPGEACGQLTHFADHVEHWRAAHEAVRTMTLRHLAAMAQDYRALYGQALTHAQVFTPTSAKA
jgi:glycosyltransferase involved in cell wall biosynthesis